MSILVGPVLVAEEDPGAGGYRTFKNSEGKEIRARLITVEDGSIVLRSSLGQEFTTPLSGLSDNDQGYVEEWDSLERMKSWMGEKGVDGFLKEKGFSVMPLQMADDVLEATASVNGADFNFKVDPGRFLTIINKEQALASGVEMSDIAYGDFPLETGGMETVFGGTFKSFVVGEAEFSPWDMGVADLPKIGFDAIGLLGADFFHLNDALIDWENKRVFLMTEKEAPESAPVPAELRGYTDTQGRKLMGEWVSQQDGVVTIKTDGGRKVEIPVASLSREDQEYVEMWNSNPRRKGVSGISINQILELTGRIPVPYDYGNSTVAAFEMTHQGETLRFLLNTTLPLSYLSNEAAGKLGLDIETTPDKMMVEGNIVPVQLARGITLATEGDDLKPFDFQVLELAPGGKLAAPIRTCMVFRFPELAARSKAVDVDGILGLDWMIANGAVVDYLAQTLFVKPKS